MSKQQQDPRNHFETETKIIAENDTYAIIALRVEKAFFRRHLHLLASLAGVILLGEP